MELISGNKYTITSRKALLRGPVEAIYTSSGEHPEFYPGDVVHWFVVADHQMVVGLLESDIGPGKPYEIQVLDSG